MQMTKKQAETVGRIFDLPGTQCWSCRRTLQGIAADRGPDRPLIYRWYEIVNVYGTTIKELIHEEFGDGIMSAIDFSMDISREPHEKGDRVHVVMSGNTCRTKPIEENAAHAREHDGKRDADDAHGGSRDEAPFERARGVLHHASA